jgi:hypothetical protein
MLTRKTPESRVSESDSSGSKTLEPVHNNPASLEVRCLPDQLEDLDAATAIEPGQAKTMEAIKRGIFGGTDVQGW